MADDIVLKFEIADGAIPDAENVARALIAYIDMLKVANSVLDPGSRLEVGLAGVEHGSDVFRLVLQRLEGHAETIKAGMEDFPLVSKAAMMLAGSIVGTLFVIGVTELVTPDPRIPDDQMAVFEDQRRLLEQSVELQREQNRFFGILHDEPAIDRLDVLRGFDRSVVFSVPQEDFASRSGLWTGEDDVTDTRTVQTRTATWDVVLIKPVLVAEPRRWMFVRDGIEFSARMDDKLFLDAINQHTLTVPLAEGIRMRIEVKYREEFDGNAWLPVKGTHRVSQVLEPLPPPPVSPLFTRPG